MKLSLSPSDDQSSERHPYPSVSVEIPHDDASIEQIFDSLVIPLLVAFGYDRKVIDDYLDSKPPSHE